MSGDTTDTSPELRKICINLNILIGKKGTLTALEDYWDVATFFEISVLADRYANSVQVCASTNIVVKIFYTSLSQACECMFLLKTPSWKLKTTLGNIELIQRFKTPSDPQPEFQIYEFWMEYFVNATKDNPGDEIKFPILIWEPTKVRQEFSQLI